MKIAIIGAGAAGLCAGRHCLQQGYKKFAIFEQTGNVGGTWNYTDCVGLDENGLSVHSSMYKDLRTNLPKELMAYEDFPYPKKQQSYIFQPEVLEYINNFANNFQIKSYVKFFKQVLNVNPSGNQWTLEIRDVKSNTTETVNYDVVFVCNGHYKDPFIPAIKGIKSFPGGVKHSHLYRSADFYKDKIVLVIGAGPSGLDISGHIAKVAKKVIVSHKLESLSLNVVGKPEVREICGNEVEFQDGTKEEIDEVLFCTGYQYSFSFLSNNCKVKVEKNFIYPLYMHVINIENPTMAFIGIPFTVCPFPMFDIQVRFFLATLNHFKLPSKKQMWDCLNGEIAANKEQGIPMRHYHRIGSAENQEKYFCKLAELANIKKIPPVISKLYEKVRMEKNVNDCFQLIDENNFLQIA